MPRKKTENIQTDSPADSGSGDNEIFLNTIRNLSWITYFTRKSVYSEEELIELNNLIEGYVQKGKAKIF